MTDASTTGARWLCCHLGAREHYAVPRALHRRRRLHRLITDAWVAPRSLWSHLPGDAVRRLSERFHPELADAVVQHFTPSLMAHEAVWRSRRQAGWTQVIERNRWFGRRAAADLRRVHVNGPARTIVFAHSYSAYDVFAHARSRGWMTVLGQIDPGEEHFRTAAELSTEYREYGPAPAAPPPAYFSAWRAECALADTIVVNSEWARRSLERAGIAPEKLRVIPLAYEPEAPAPEVARAYPPAFSTGRPLRVLFVGHVAVVKGAAALLEAVAQLGDLPLELRMVGALSMAVPARFLESSAIRWCGAVSRGEVMRHYRECDVLIFPSHSDGFGMAQVEAQAWRLPVIASRSCGAVVKDGVNGITLADVSPQSIATALRRVAGAPDLLRQFARQSPADGLPGLDGLAEALVALERP